MRQIIAAACALLLLVLTTAPATADALSIDDLLALRALGYDDAQIVAEIRRTGTRIDLTPAQRKRLTDGGLGPAVLRALGTATPVPRPDPTPAPRAGEAQTYEHVTRRFALRYPAGWRLVRSLDDGTVIDAVTPEPGKTTVDALERCLAVMLLPVEPGSVLATLTDPVERLRQLLPTIRQAQPGLVADGAPQAAPLGTLAGARWAVRGTLDSRRVTVRGELRLAVDDDVMLLVYSLSPQAHWDADRAVFARILAGSRFGRPRPHPRGAVQEGSELVARYEPGVVSVMAHKGGEPQGFGTGFVIHPGGYVATNAHVVANLKTMQAFPEFTVEWTSRLGKRRLPATLVGWRFEMSRLHLHHGADVAILKLPAGTYTALPLTRGTDARLGDPVIAMGFPRRDLHTTLNIYITRGVVTRFNRGLDQRIESILTDAKATHGSSGGPCIDLKTGGVIGLNTFGTDIRDKASDALELNNMVGYSGVVPTDTLIREFPLVAGLGRDHDARLPFLDLMSLAQLSFGRGAYTATRELLRRALALQPRAADALCLDGLCMLEAATSERLLLAAAARLKQALAVDANHEQALLALALAYAEHGERRQGEPFADRAVKAHPDSWRARLVGAQLLLAGGRGRLALEQAQAAIRLAGGLTADPHLLAGQILYRLGRHDEGRAAYRQACRIEPRRAEGWIGAAFALELRKDHAGALRAYRAVADRGFAEDPILLTRIGTCQGAGGDAAAALASFARAAHSAERRGAAPPDEALLEGGRLGGASEKLWGQGIALYAKYLLHYGRAAGAARVHVAMADVLLKFAKPARGIAYAQLSKAKALGAKAEAAQRLGTGRWVKTSMQDISVMLKAGYAAPVVADIIADTPLAFGIDLKNPAHIKALKQAGIPPLVARAILQSNKRWPPEPPAPPVAGVWRGRSPEIQGVVHQATLILKPGGEYLYSYDIFRMGMQMPVEQEAGRYQLGDGRITYTVEKHSKGEGVGRTYGFGYTLSGDTLTLHNLPSMGGRDMVLQRVKE